MIVTHTAYFVHYDFDKSVSINKRILSYSTHFFFLIIIEILTSDQNFQYKFKCEY